MIYHVLPGDSIVREFKATDIDGETIVFRECLIDGDISASSLDEFWSLRANFIELKHGGDPIEYREGVAYELERLTELGDRDEINLWFEFELFCSANMWFCIDLLKDSRAQIFRVMPGNVLPDDVWKGFAEHDADALQTCFENRVELNAADITAGSSLWHAFAERDAGKLRVLGDYRSAAFPFLKEVADAAAEIEHRPEMVLQEIMRTGATGLADIYPEFKKRAGVYGFGDLQVERILTRD